GGGAARAGAGLCPILHRAGPQHGGAYRPCAGAVRRLSRRLPARRSAVEPGSGDVGRAGIAIRQRRSQGICPRGGDRRRQEAVEPSARRLAVEPDRPGRGARRGAALADDAWRRPRQGGRAVFRPRAEDADRLRDAALPRLRRRSQQVSFPAKKTGGGAMGWRGTGAALAIAVLIAPGARAATFKWANDGDARAMDPYTFNETVQNSFLANIYERLVQRNKKLGLEPDLATSWETTGPNVWRFHLRPNVKWQDGTPFTADDVVFSYHRITGKNSAKRSQVATVKEMRKVDDLTVDIETNGPDPILPSEMTAMDVMSKAWCEAHGAAENVVFGKGENYALTHAMGTGPYQLVSREPDRRTVVEKNPNYWGKIDGNVDRAEFDVISNASTRVA